MKIVDRYMKFCSKAGQSDELLRRFAAVKIDENEPPSNSSTSSLPWSASLSRLSVNVLDADNSSNEDRDLSVLIMAMRKLREGIVASKRIDDFSMQAYMFCIRLSILVKHMESYHPALLHLLHKMHPVKPLSNVDLQEFSGYLVLDLACRRGDLAQAHVIRRHFKLKDPKIDAILKSLAHDNYHIFWRTKKIVDGHKLKMMEFAEDRMRKHTLKCFGRTYFTLDKAYVELVTDCPWTNLVRDYQVGWELQESNIIIRRPKGR